MLFARLNSASVEPKARWSQRPKRGTIRETSGVIGLAVNRKPTWMTLPATATMNMMASRGSEMRTR